MGCLEVTARCLTLPIAVSAWGQKELEVSAFSSVPEMVLSASAINKKLDITCGLVCSITSKEYYLNVVPDTVWMSADDLEAYFNIYSNVTWKIHNNESYIEVSKSVL